MTDTTFKEWAEEFGRQLTEVGLTPTQDRITLTVRLPRFLRGYSHAHTRKIHRERRARMTYVVIRFTKQQKEAIAQRIDRELFDTNHPRTTRKRPGYTT